MPASRRLTAILAADVVGYSRLMGADEEGTHERFKAHLRELVDPKIREHHGRIVKTTGDGVLAEFASVIDAVRCAGEIQCAMPDRDLDLAEELRQRFRIGVNLGDVIVDEDDIYGDGVNIAARLEGLAAPGGICVSGTVRDHIGDRLPYAFEDMGEQNVKNIARPVRAYALRPERVAVLPPPDWRRGRPGVSGLLSARRPLLRSSSLAWRGGSGRRQPPPPEPGSRRPKRLRLQCPCPRLRPRRQSRSRSSHRACRSSYCPSPISATTRSNNILPTGSPRI
jgi:adenylate cyclase